MSKLKKVVGFVVLFLMLSVVSSYGKDWFPVYGKGKVEVRIYTDYFCGPCQLTEPDLEVVLKSLMEKKKVKVSFIDMPFFKPSSAYNKYFLYAAKDVKDFDRALEIRRILFEAAARKVVEDEDGLKVLFDRKNVKYQEYELKPVYDEYIRLNKEDQVTSTPTIVVIDKGKKQKLIGGADIISTLTNLEK